ncbi:hypothetical protein [Variovorax sp. PAMC 28711]|uniref:hypothetical protein n=1 Tax=Variovorax sp. PAMC 28711 TaxID=1795631 RepID=UPI000AE4EFAD|nr:hypothetical protein [Variovorax sp. PAMC 28711]
MNKETNQSLPELRKALLDAAKSLQTISVQAGRGEFMTEDSEVRAYAASRARVAFDALQAIAAPPEGWQPIETAPKNGTAILALWTRFPHMDLNRDCYSVVAWIDDMHWASIDEVDHAFASPDRWMPLPPPPKTTPAAPLAVEPKESKT